MLGRCSWVMASGIRVRLYVWWYLPDKSHIFTIAFESVHKIFVDLQSSWLRMCVNIFHAHLVLLCFFRNLLRVEFKPSLAQPIPAKLLDCGNSTRRKRDQHSCNIISHSVSVTQENTSLLYSFMAVGMIHDFLASTSVIESSCHV